eukprot:5433953-Prymnesium_polylepis.1
MAHGTWHMAHGTWHLAPGTWHMQRACSAVSSTAPFCARARVLFSAALLRAVRGGASSARRV